MGKLDEPRSSKRDKPPSFQFYPDDFLSSRAVQLMTPEQRGGYIMLLCWAWKADEPGILPLDDALLARLSGLQRRWGACRAAILEAFDIDGTSIVQPKMREVRLEQIERRERAQHGANLTNAKRWGRTVG